MSAMTCADYQDLVAADVDGELRAEERAAASTHVETCAQCRQLRADQVAVKTRLRTYAARQHITAPDAAGVAGALSASDAESVPRRRSPALRVGMVGSIAALFILALRTLWSPAPPALLATLAADVRAANAGAIQLAMQTDDAATLRQYYRQTGRVPFAQSVDDFTQFGLRLLGGTVAHVGAVDTTLSVYEVAGEKVVCRRFLVGTLPDPEGGQEADGMRVFTVEGITVIFMRLGNVWCCLATRMPAERFVHQLHAAHEQRAARG